MPQTYLFKGVDRLNRKRKGQVVTVDRDSALAKLNRRGIKIKRLRRRIFFDIFSRDFEFIRPKLPLSDILWICRNLSSLITSGLRLPEACELIADQRAGKRPARVMTEIRLDLEAGMGVSDAFAQQQNRFGKVPTAMLKAGESTGSLIPTFDGITKLCESQIQLRSNLRRAVQYPLAVMSTTFVVLLAMVLFVVPRFVEMYSNLNAKLPALTQFVVDVSITLTRQAWAFPTTIGLLVILGVLLRKLPTGRIVTDNIFLKLPKLGTLIHRSITTRSAATLSALLTAKVPMLDSLEMTAEASGNVVFREAFLGINGLIAQGESVTDSFASIDDLPLVFRDLAAVGDASGDLAGVLRRYANDSEIDLKRDGEDFAKALEPYLILSLGGVVGLVIVALYLPIFQLVTLVG